MSYDLFELSITSELSKIKGDVTKMSVNSLEKNNNLLIMVKSGAKGSDVNIGQFNGCLGQLIIAGARVQKKINNRTLPHFHQNDDTSISRGFIASSFLEGLNPIELFFSTMSGREGLIDTAIKTATTGYIQRKLRVGLEDVVVSYDGTLRNTSNQIIQYLYGNNGTNQTCQTEIKINSVNMNNKDIIEKYIFNDKEINQIYDSIKKNTKIDKSELTKLNKQYEKMLLENRDELRKIQIIATNNYKTTLDKYMLPFNILRIVQDNIKDEHTSIILSPIYILDNIRLLIDRLKLFPYKDNQPIKKSNDNMCKYLIKIVLYEYLAPKRCIYEYNFTKENFENVIIDIEKAFVKSIVDPGEMVGVIAAQSLGEIATQLTLDSKHAAGSAKKGAIGGIPRIKELLNYSKDIKTPQMKIYFEKEYNEDILTVNRISSFLKFVTIEELTLRSEIYYNPSDNNKLAVEINEDLTDNSFFIGDKVDIKQLPWLFRIKLSREKMLEKETTLLDIKTKFISYWYNNFMDLKQVKKHEKDILSNINRVAILANNDNSSIPIIHIRFSMHEFDYYNLTEFLNLVLKQIKLKGITKIKDIDIGQERLTLFDEKTGDENVIKERIVTTDGINFKDVRNIKGIDFNRTFCNDINTIYKLYGIEAVRNALLNEFFLSYGDGINNHHVEILIDIMICNGFIVSIDRHGMNRLDNEPLTKAAFEKTMEHFENAAIFGETDLLKSVTARVMLGKVINGGTGFFKIALNTDFLSNTEVIDNEFDIDTTNQLLMKNDIMSDILAQELKDDFFIPK